MSQKITIPIQIKISEKVATCLTETPVVCGNSNYVAHFEFDEEWDIHDVKTAVFNVDGVKTKKPFRGSVCPMPAFKNTLLARVGVFAGTIDDGTLSTSTSAIVHCKPCATDGEDISDPPQEDVYDQIVQMCEDALETAESVEERANNGEFNGKDGYTPVKGVDYYTENEKEEFVKEAIEGVRASEKQYELIEEITLAEAVASFTRNMDTNGEPYNLSAIRVKVNAPAAEGATSTSQIIFNTKDARGNSTIYHQVTGGLGTSARVSYLVARNECGMIDYYIVNSAVNNTGARYVRDGYVIRPWKNIASFIISTYPTTVLIPAGTTITIYGIKEATNEA